MPRLTLIELRRGTAAAWTLANPVLANGEPGFEDDTNKMKVGDGVTAWNLLPYISGGGGSTGVSSIAKSGSTALTGAVTFTGGTNVTLTQAGQDISIAASPGSPGAGASSLVYRYTVTGSDKASIDTGADTPDAGSNDWTNGDLLEIFLYARSDESVTSSQMQFIFNNDTTSIYDVTRLTGQNGGVSSASFASLGRFLADVPGASATASIFGSVAMVFPNYAGTVGFKVGSLQQSLPEPSTSAMEYQSFAASAISRFKVIPNVALKKLKVGSQLLIYKRLAS